MPPSARHYGTPLGLSLALAAFLWPAGIGANAAPVQRTILIDGEQEDWAEVLTSPFNAARDGEGNMGDCSLSTDLDCTLFRPFPSLDLQHFAWTFDDTNLFFYFTTYGGFQSDRHYLIYLDTSHDGLMQTGEPLLHLAMDALGAADSPLSRTSYLSVAPGGDAMLSPDNLADGFPLPGQPLGAAVPVGSVNGKPSENFIELSIPWAELGLAPDSPLTFHVSTSANFDPWPVDLIHDNMAGSLGGRGTTAHRSLDVQPGVSIGSAPFKTVLLRHLISNDGNVRDVVRLEAGSLRGFDIQIFRDSDEDGFPETPLAVDIGGDTLFDQPGDLLYGAGDRDTDGLLDIGELGPGERALIVLQQDYDEFAAGIEEISLAAWFQGDPDVRGTATDVIRIGEITLREDESVSGARGGEVWIPHVLSNNSLEVRTFDLGLNSAEGWTYELHLDTGGLGDPADAGPALVDGDASGLPDVTVSALASASLLVHGSIPPSAPLTTLDLLDVEVFLASELRDSVRDQITVAAPVDVSPDYLLAAGMARYGGSGDSIYFPHVITNATSLPDSYTVSLDCDLGWPVFLLDDPEADGLPYGSALLPGRTDVVAANGGRYNFLVRVDVPDTAPVGRLGHVTVHVQSTNDELMEDTVGDDALVAIVRTYQDPTHSLNIIEARPCTTVHALATGLQASRSGFRFVWRDGSGASRQVSPAVTDSEGICEDSLLLEDGDLGEGWAVEIREWDGFEFELRDTARYAVDDPAHLEALNPTRPSLDQQGEDLAASLSLVNDSLFQELNGLRVRWVVLSPDGLDYLTPAGTFSPYSGVETTRESTATVPASSTLILDLNVANVDFLSLGVHGIEATLLGYCAAGGPVLNTTFLVIDDADGDGLSADDEEAAGTDPADADSDDDGLLDGEDGLGDSDGDGQIDALDCDSDDDGLFDGLESGVFSPHPDTDASAGCLQLDLWPATTTDPDLADTDGGGIDDGLEDWNGDGRVGIGETDPQDPSDDTDVDGDGDGIPTLEELNGLTDPLDADSDDDGLLDGEELLTDTDGDGIIDALDCDSDDDSLLDGLESGLTGADPPHPDTDDRAGCWKSDKHPGSTTSPLLADSDGGGVPDGIEDENHNGKVDRQEGDPNDPGDDSSICSFDLPELLDLRVNRVGRDALLGWSDHRDPCTHQDVMASEAASSLDSLAGEQNGTSYLDSRPTPPGAIFFYRVRGISLVGGVGP